MDEINALRVTAAKASIFKVLFIMIYLGGVDITKSKLNEFNLSLPTIRQALDTLQRWGWATHTNQHWSLTNGLQKSFDVKKLSPTTTLNINTKETINTKELKSSSSEKNFHLLKSLGIGEPMLSRLASMEHITDDYLDKHIAAWRKNNKPVGILINDLRDNIPAPKKELTHEEELRHDREHGEFKDFIEY